ncbi:hypothetical protein DGo_CA0488 [Deinococcus gobiensis I-0]|uniref:Uncharacterized protein n=1 Tax=Deinococcus gobiensis (strain DSM 21396 / JCM 16679 / CGMCC 1.7299 / I-0) TaxID=745776 RepID=H8GW50_DEIGI|nr:hypothetical protein DGo_CA0488 [Deinococcus gobiensis I-0]
MFPLDRAAACGPAGAGCRLSATGRLPTPTPTPTPEVLP